MSSLIDDLKKNESIEKRIDSEDNVYRIRVIGRGENLFFQEWGNAKKNTFQKMEKYGEV